MDYRESGVDVKKAERFVGFLKRKFDIYTGFGGQFSVPGNYKKPVFISSCDGVGTKLLIAILSGIHNTVGIDLVAMNVNDILCRGARPLMFMDYLAVGKIEMGIVKSIVSGIVTGCKEAGCKLIGGETAEMPDMYPLGKYDMAGFCVGVVERRKMLPKTERIKEGDAVIGVASSGIHSNGFSLVRKVFSKQVLIKRAEEFLVPTRIYVKPVLKLLEQVPVKQIAHITGGGFPIKAVKGLPDGFTVELWRGSWDVPEIFLEIQKRAKISDKQMYSTFNMGIGLTLVVSPKYVDMVLDELGKTWRCWQVGRIVCGNSLVIKNVGGK